MLHAFNHNKSQRYLAYIENRSADEKRISKEDEITSIILGPLDFFSAGDSYLFWQRTISHDKRLSMLLPATPPTTVEATFWPSGKTASKGRRVEPDAIFRYKWDDGTQRILLIELKWRSPLSGDDQLKRQWSCLTPDEQRDALHVFIGPDIKAGLHARSNKMTVTPENAERLTLVTWSNIRCVFDELLKQQSPLKKWAHLSNQFLDKIGIQKFSGFAEIAQNINIDSINELQLFWNAHSFTGFSILTSEFNKLNTFTISE